MKKTLVGLGIVIALLTVVSVMLPALVSVADAGWFGLLNLPPSIISVSPTGVQSASPSFTLLVSGTNFASNSVVRWNGADRVTTYVSPTRLTAIILDTDVATVATASVTVFNPGVGGGESSAASVSINSKPNTTTTIVSDLPDPSQVNLSVTVVYTVTGSGGTPTGSVTVTDSASSANCSGSVAAGNCTLVLSSAGRRMLVATYSGDTTFNDSSGTATHTAFGPGYLPWVPKQPTPTLTPTRTPIPIPNPVQNGGFESVNTQDGPWFGSMTDTNNSTFGVELRDTLSGTGASPHSGSWALYLGGEVGVTPRIIKWETLQKITIPPVGGTILRYWHWVQSSEPVCDLNNIDGAWVSLIQENPYDLHFVDSFALCQANRTNGWVKRDIDLSAYAGQTRWLAFTARTYGLVSNWFIDDVAMGTLSGAQFIPYKR